MIGTSGFFGGRKNAARGEIQRCGVCVLTFAYDDDDKKIKKTLFAYENLSRARLFCFPR